MLQQWNLHDAASDTSVILGARWNDAVKSYACSQQAITQNKGEGRLYCFAIDQARAFGRFAGAELAVESPGA